MSALGDTLATKDREYVLRCKITIAVDAATTDAAPTYSVLLEAPETSETLLETQDAADVSAAVTEFTDWAAAKW